jgi:hypothetical protein
VPTRNTATTRKTGTTPTAAKRKASVAKSTKKTAAVPPRKKAPAKKKVADEEVTIDRRRATRPAEEATAPAPKLERRKKVNRRRQIDPTTCERDYSDQEVAFMNALDDYKRKSGRMFPTCSEVLEVIRSLGYVQLNASERAQLATEENSFEQPVSWSPACDELEEAFEDELV